MEKRILLIDDDSSDLEALLRMLHNQRQNWGIYFARSVDAALEKISRVAFDAIVLDVNRIRDDGEMASVAFGYTSESIIHSPV